MLHRSTDGIPPAVRKPDACKEVQQQKPSAVPWQHKKHYTEGKRYWPTEMNKFIITKHAMWNCDKHDPGKKNQNLNKELHCILSHLSAKLRPKGK